MSLAPLRKTKTTAPDKSNLLLPAAESCPKLKHSGAVHSLYAAIGHPITREILDAAKACRAEILALVKVPFIDAQGSAQFMYIDSAWLTKIAASPLNDLPGFSGFSEFLQSNNPPKAITHQVEGRCVYQIIGDTPAVTRELLKRRQIIETFAAGIGLIPPREKPLRLSRYDTGDILRLGELRDGDRISVFTTDKTKPYITATLRSVTLESIMPEAASDERGFLCTKIEGRVLEGGVVTSPIYLIGGVHQNRKYPLSSAHIECSKRNRQEVNGLYFIYLHRKNSINLIQFPTAIEIVPHNIVPFPSINHPYHSPRTEFNSVEFTLSRNLTTRLREAKTKLSKLTAPRSPSKDVSVTVTFSDSNEIVLVQFKNTRAGATVTMDTDGVCTLHSSQLGDRARTIGIEMWVHALELAS